MQQAFLALGAATPIRETWAAREKAIADRDSFVDQIPTVMVMEESKQPKGYVRARAGLL